MKNIITIIISLILLSGCSTTKDNTSERNTNESNNVGNSQMDNKVDDNSKKIEKEKNETLNWQKYSNKKLELEFSHPSECIIEEERSGVNSVSVLCEKLAFTAWETIRIEENNEQLSLKEKIETIKKNYKDQGGTPIEKKLSVDGKNASIVSWADMLGYYLVIDDKDRFVIIHGDGLLERLGILETLKLY